MNVPVYDFPNSPILILGFFGILVAIATLFIAYSKYFNSPLNRDKKFVKNSLEFEFKKFSSKVSWHSKLLIEIYSNFHKVFGWFYSPNNLLYRYNNFLFYKTI